MYGLLGLLPTSGENIKSTAPLEIYLLGTMVTCSRLILPAVSGVYIWSFLCSLSLEVDGEVFNREHPAALTERIY